MSRAVYRRGKVWWICYWHRGKRYRISSGSERHGAAVRLLKQHLERVGRGGAPGNVEERVTLKDLAADLERDYEINRRRSLESAKIRVKNLLAVLRPETRALDIRADRIREYIAARQAQGASNATINRETGALKRMFRLALEAEKLTRIPSFPKKLEEPPPREGFFEFDEYAAIREHLPEDLQDVLDFMYNSGWRKGEILSLRWSDLDVAGGIIRLRAAESKNKRSRLLPLSAPIKAVIARRQEKRFLACPYVFHRGGREIKSMDGAWDVAREAAGLPEKLMHDCRRTVARNLIRAGVSTDVARRHTGHLTASIFSRYNVTVEADQKQAADCLAAYMEEQASKKKVLKLAKGQGA